GSIASFDISGASCMVGRSEHKCDLVITDRKASGTHAELRFRDGQVTVHDMGSTNGTHFEGDRQDRPFRLVAGAHFGIGDTRLRLVTIRGLEPEPAPAPTPDYDLDDLGTDEATQALDLSQYRKQLEQSVKARADDRALDDTGLDDTMVPIGRDAPSQESERGYPSSVDLPQDASGRTVAFDRSQIELGDFDVDYVAKPPPRSGPPRSGPPRGSQPSRPKAGSTRRARGMIGWLGLTLLVPYAIAMSVLMGLKPGTDVKTPEIDAADPAGALMALASVSWAFANGEYMFGSLLGGDSFATAEIHYKHALAAWSSANEADEQADRVESLTELTTSVGYLTGSVSSYATHMDASRMIIWITMGAGLLGGILLFVRWRMTAGIVMLIGVGVPFAIYQPTPVEPMIFTGLVALFGLCGVVSYFIGRPAR
ncbi:MAG: hypothetical protein ACI9OJ_001461, partial [Myxococcota bacterium]